MAFLAKSVLLAVTARAGAHFYRANLSERSVPKRVKLGLAMMITFAIAPSLPANDVPVFSFFALWLAVQQILIGIALGFTMQFAFAAVRTAGEIIGLQMGLSFATFVDPATISICLFMRVIMIC